VHDAGSKMMIHYAAAVILRYFPEEAKLLRHNFFFQISTRIAHFSQIL
jgi:hypothetical protein